MSYLYNCRKQSTNGKCLECSQGSYVNSTGSCQAVNPLCRTYNFSTGDCLSCYQGYSLLNGTCKISSNDPNCKTINSLT